MSFKRSRAAFEADLRAQQSPYALYGTPLPPLDPEVRDDGSYVPVWRQEVRDERGRKRLHGAFTGGFSAGYFNTVGSKEGWTPSTFVSSRSNRHNSSSDVKDGGDSNNAAAARRPQQRPEDFMDEEDLADAAERERLQTAQGFAGFGSTEDDGGRRGGGGGGIADLFRVRGETMGVKLLKRMGWKEGQGVGPKVRRKARLDVGGGGSGGLGPAQDVGQVYLFAPDNVQMIAFVKKTDRKGIGYAGEPRLGSLRPGPKAEAGGSSDEGDGERGGPLLRRPNVSFAKKKAPARPAARGGIGIGVLNDTGSDDEDPYEVGPRISYNRVIGGGDSSNNNSSKKKKAAKPKITPAVVNPALGAAPVFVSRKSTLARAGKNLRRCHDGRLPLDGFVFGTEPDTLTSVISSAGKYPPPKIPEGWKSSRQTKQQQQQQQSQQTTTGTESSSAYVSAADAARASKLDPKSRAALLGEAQLPGKSVFDFLSPAARDRLAAATGKANLPPALGEVPAGHHVLSDAERQAQLLRQVPQLDRTTALAALARGTGGGGGGGGTGPYADNDAKRARYRAYLEWCVGLGGTGANPSTGGNNNTGSSSSSSNSNSALSPRPPPPPPERPPGTSTEDWLRELNEFHSCARIFRPITGVMASRFTTASKPSKATLDDKSKGAVAAGAEGGGGGGGGNNNDHLSSSNPPPPPAKPADPAEEAARLGMYGPMTRSVADFYPSRLLCKRFGVRPPAHADMEQEGAKGKGGGAGAGAGAGASISSWYGGGGSNTSSSAGAMTLDEMMRQAQAQAQASAASLPSSSNGAGVGASGSGGNADAEAGAEQLRPPPPPASQDVQVKMDMDVDVKPDVNEALEGQRAQDDVLRAIFGDSSDDEE
ncbi:hypothetical protein SLS62_004252 [Diatrype stigma]|uniref:G-patch domain-containing protein n=1 Tax=Diatrype stigma TaxID=117547 RepID=A0AAN9UUV3_9PEZI